MITAEEIQNIDQSLRDVGKGVDHGGRWLHNALCQHAKVEANLAERYTEALCNMLFKRMHVNNERKSMIATVVRHAFLAGVIAGRNERGKPVNE